MITKKRVLWLACALGLSVALPLAMVVADVVPWITIPAVCCGMAAVAALCLRYGNVIVGTYRILLAAVKNRIYGYRSSDRIYPLISVEQQQQLDDAIQISFTGDLILLREMVERAYNPDSGEYEFDAMFTHVSDIWQSCDLSIGVFEGPMCGAEYGYSTSNFDDGVPLALNFPDSFACAVKKAGINLVSLANNHIFDMGVESGLRTIRVLDEIGLDHVGLGTDDSACFRPKIIEICGKRIGVLAYTYGQNGKTDRFFFDESTRNYLRPVLAAGSKYFKRNVELVRRDFERLKAEKPDMIIVLPHMGGQFLSKPDKTQRKWCDIFVEFGADMVFADHAHHVQSVQWRVNKSGKRVLVVHCPGNFINSFVGYDGDASMIVKAYLRRDTLEPFAVSVTPLYAHCPQNGMWTGLPAYKALTDKAIYNSLSRADFRRINHVNRLVTGIALGTPLDVDAAQKEYISFCDSGLVRQIPPPIEITDNQYVTSCLLMEIREAESICFLGDSVTEGTKNGGAGWYEPLLALFPEKQIKRFAKGSRTSVWLLENAAEIAELKSDLYVVAIGCNDIRYRNPAVCAMTAEAYIGNLSRLVDEIKRKNKHARFVFIAPWRSLNFDANFNVSGHEDRMALYREYTEALELYCDSNGHLFIDPNPLIFDNMLTPYTRTVGGNEILKDFIHPNASDGIAAYCNAAVMCKQINDNATI